MKDLNKRMIENAQKVAFIAKTYPEKNIVEVSQMFQTSPIEFNAGAWAAQDLGYIEVDKEGVVTIKDLPSEWSFGDLIEHLMVELPFTIGKLNINQADIEDEYLTSWCAGFPAQDVIIATKLLLEQGKLASYEVKNETKIEPNREQRRKGAEKKTIVDTYTFYTLPENADKRWGEKQFIDPEQLQKEEA